MKTSNKILILCLLIAVSIPIIDALIVKAKKQRNEISIEDYFAYKDGKHVKNMLSVEKLQNFKHLKVVGNGHSQMPLYPFRFSYADSCFAFSSKNGKRNEFTIEYQNDTLILNLEKYKFPENEEFAQFHLFAPELASVTLEKSSLFIMVDKQEANNQNLRANLYDSNLGCSKRIQIYSEEQKTPVHFLSVNVNGENSRFSSDIDAKTMNINLKGKSVFHADRYVNFDSFSGKVSKETQLEIPKEYAEKLIIEEEK